MLNGRGGACGTSNYRNPVGKFAEFSFTEPIKRKTPSPEKMLIKCNSGRKYYKESKTNKRMKILKLLEKQLHNKDYLLLHLKRVLDFMKVPR